MDGATTVTNHDFTREACAERIQKLLDSPPLTLAARGGGIGEEITILPNQTVIISRDELREVLGHLRASEASP